MSVGLSEKRARQLNLEGYTKGSQLPYCPRCPFQMEPETVGLNWCPDCNTSLHCVTVNDALLRLINGDDFDLTTYYGAMGGA